MGVGKTWVKNAWPSNAINLKKNIPIMTTLMSFSASESQNQANKSHHHSAHHTNTNNFGRGVDMKKFSLKQTRRKILLQIKCPCFSPSCSPSYLLSYVLCAPIHASNIYVFKSCYFLTLRIPFYRASHL